VGRHDLHRKAAGPYKSGALVKSQNSQNSQNTPLIPISCTQLVKFLTGGIDEKPHHEKPFQPFFLATSNRFFQSLQQ